jgi:hypothetical protein
MTTYTVHYQIDGVPQSAREMSLAASTPLDRMREARDHLTRSVTLFPGERIRIARMDLRHP